MSNKFQKWLLGILITIDLALVAVLVYQLYVTWFLAEFVQNLV